MKIQNAGIALAILITLDLLSATVHAQSAAFTYQGRLNDGDGVANGSYDFIFTLYDAPTNGTVIGALTNNAVDVTNGMFTTVLDFGAAFTGSNYWLEIAVETNGDSVFATLTPRQPITSVPYALYAPNAANADFATSASVAANSPAGVLGSASTNNTADFDAAGAAQTALDNYGQSAPANMTNGANYFAGAGLDINGNITVANSTDAPYALTVNGNQTNNGNIYISWNGTAGISGIQLQTDGGIISGGYLSLITDNAWHDLDHFVGLMGFQADVPYGFRGIGNIYYGPWDTGVIDMFGNAVNDNGDGHLTNAALPYGNDMFHLGEDGRLYLINWIGAEHGAKPDGTTGWCASASTNAYLNLVTAIGGQGSGVWNTNLTDFAFRNDGTQAMIGYSSGDYPAGVFSLIPDFNGVPNAIIIDTNNSVTIPNLDSGNLSWFGTASGDGRGIINILHTTTSAATSGTVAVATQYQCETTYLSSPSTISSITIALPSSDTVNGQVFKIHSQSAVSSMNVTGGSFADAAVTSMTAGQTISYQAVDESGTYIRIR
ncbi:MAG TPA: hypothetical protein VHG71_09375 [Verrucomicrobiae bacterium]|nr:hypothetical protein [Verrucomicrobiae bacterium]